MTVATTGVAAAAPWWKSRPDGRAIWAGSVLALFAVSSLFRLLTTHGREM